MRVGPGPGPAGRTLVGSECAQLLSSMSRASAELCALLTTAGAGHRRAAALRQQDVEQVWVTQLPNPCPRASPQHHTGARRCPLGPGRSSVTSCEHPALGARPRSRPLSASPAVARLPGVGWGGALHTSGTPEGIRPVPPLQSGCESVLKKQELPGHCGVYRRSLK